MAIQTVTIVLALDTDKDTGTGTIQCPRCSRKLERTRRVFDDGEQLLKAIYADYLNHCGAGGCR